MKTIEINPPTWQFTASILIEIAQSRKGDLTEDHIALLKQMGEVADLAVSLTNELHKIQQGYEKDVGYLGADHVDMFNRFNRVYDLINIKDSTT